MNALLLAVLGIGTSFAQSGACEKVGIGKITSDAAPHVLFLGARHASRRDLARARRIVKKLADQGPVTLAMEPVWAGSQRALDRLQNQRLRFERLEEALRWSENFPYSFQPYERLLQMHELPNVTLLAAGQPIELVPDGQTVAVPAGYSAVLGDATGDGPVPASLSDRFTETVAWHDRRVAQTALDGWSGEGWLVVLVDRTWVEGGLGMPWQADQLTDVAVSSALLANAKTRCYDGDRVITSFLGLF